MFGPEQCCMEGSLIRRQKKRRMIKERIETQIRVDQEECSKNELDRLNELPEDILIKCITRLPFHEVIATSILSTSWRHIHTHVLSLNFEFLYDQQKELKDQYKYFSDYINRINQAIDSYKGDMHVSNAFRLHMPCSEKKIDKWLTFGLSRKVEIIDLCILPCDRPRGCCCSLVIRLTALSCKQSLHGVKKLTLSLIYLDDHDMELILSNFVFLEHLSIDSPGIGYGKRMMNPMFVGHCKLTHLNISSRTLRTYIQSIEVRDMINLVSLRLYKLNTTRILLLDNVPKLVDFNIGDGTHKEFHKAAPEILHKISCIHHQLLNLELSIVLGPITKRCGFTFPKLINLKHMELSVNIMEDRDGTHQLFPLIEACPSLEKLDIKFLWSSKAMMYVHRVLDENRVKRNMSTRNLKNVKLSGYFGSVSELELVGYLMNNAEGLQELTVEACDVTPEIRRGAIARASRCLQFVPLNPVNLVIM